MSEKTAKADRKVVKESNKPTNGELFLAMEALGKLGNVDFHVSDSLKLRKLRHQLFEPFKIISEVRDALIKKYGEEEPKGSGNFSLTGPNNQEGKPIAENYQKFLQESGELFVQEADVKFEKIKLPSQVDRKPIPLSANDLDRLDKFVEII